MPVQRAHRDGHVGVAVHAREGVAAEAERGEEARLVEERGPAGLGLGLGVGLG